MNKIKKVWFVFVMLVCLTMTMSVSTMAAGKSTTAQSTQAKKKTYKAGWVKIGKKYYWRYSNGSIRKKSGYFKVGNDQYCTNKDYSRVSSTYRRHAGKYIYFQKNGKMLKPGKNCFKMIEGKKSYVYASGYLASGRVKIGKKYYYFNSKGVLQKNLRGIKVGNYYYNVDKNGVMTKTTKTKALCSQAAQNFIRKHSSSSQTNAQKFRSCFYYLNAYMRYTPGYFSSSSDYRIIDKKEGAYELALSTFNSPNLRGNCHRFAACIAAIARELGYNNPTMVVTTGDHSFVMINGGYYDNMYGGLFGASSRPAYNVYKKIVF